MGSDHVVHVHFCALLDPEIPTVAEIPGGCVTDNITILRPLQHRCSPEGIRNGSHSHRDEELIHQLEENQKSHF